MSLCYQADFSSATIPEQSFHRSFQHSRGRETTDSGFRDRYGRALNLDDFPAPFEEDISTTPYIYKSLRLVYIAPDAIKHLHKSNL